MLKCVFLPTTVANERNRARKKDVRDRHTSLLFHRPPEADDFIFPRVLIAPTHVIRSCVTWFPLINTPKLYSGAREKKWCFLVRDDDQLTHRHILINRTELVGWCYFGPHRFRLVCRLVISLKQWQRGFPTFVVIAKIQVGNKTFERSGQMEKREWMLLCRLLK